MAAEIGSFIAVGDSFTEGLSDECSDGSFRGWADLVAGQLAETNPKTTYANLAVRGRLFDEVVDEQVPEAIKQCPDLISFCAGVNDALRPGFHVHSFATRLHEVVRLIKASGAEVILFTLADNRPIFPGANAFKKRFVLINEAVRRVARRHDTVLVDLWEDKGLQHPYLWDNDRLHYSTLGHERLAAHVCEQLDVKYPDEWLEDPPLTKNGKLPSYEISHAKWAGKFLAPWVKRRLTGASSGDKVEAKRPLLTPIEPTDTDSAHHG